MDVVDKLDILSRDAQYDLSCACGTKAKEEHRTRGSGGSWIYPVTVASGGSGIMLKTLLSNACTSDCRYCPLREESDTRRTSLTPDEIASFFINFLSHKPIIGIFLSSGIIGSAEYTMDRLIASAEILRYRYHYRGYIHIKIIPGASIEAINRAMQLASAVSLNIETPGINHFSKLTHKKDYMKDIIEPLKYISQMSQKGSPFQKVHTTSQFIVGASDESDKEILSYSYNMYDHLKFDRLYFSAYQGGLGDPTIPGEIKKREIDQLPFSLSHTSKEDYVITREHRLYQADFLFRQYNFSYDDLVFGKEGNLDLSKDPKEVWATKHQEFFPVSLKKGSKEELLRVPGIGPLTAQKIVNMRKNTPLSDIYQLNLPRSLYSKAKKYIIL
ncbi:MAG: radical SAM protein [Spirochaetia bacterium]|nr:radical SAM protein [Spirochaetia bacterium]